jgi:ABC-type polysaccharide/polyol phosphate export permease
MLTTGDAAVARPAPAGLVGSLADGLRQLVSRRETLRALVERQLLLRRKRAVLGVVWPLLAPLFLLALYSFVFRAVFDVPIARYPAYLFAGLLPWTFLVTSLHQALQSISLEADLVRRARFPHEHLPLAAVAVNLPAFGVLLAGFVGCLAVAGDLEWRLLPVLALPTAALLLLVSALAMLIALVDVYNRDLRLVLNNLLTVWFFLVPIVYRQDMVPDPLRVLRSVDPMNMIVGQFRYVLYQGEVLRPAHVVLMLLVCAGVFLLSLAVFRRLSGDLAKDV